MANFTEKKGVFHCGEIAASNGWMFRPQPDDDVGIDAHMEWTDYDGTSRQLLALQIKSGNSYFNEYKDDCFIFRGINERQYNYWTRNTLPCIIVMYNPDSNLCIWEKLTSETIHRTKNGEGKGYFVKVPKKNIFLDELSNQELLAFSNLPLYITNYNFLLSQKEFIRIIHNGGEITLHSKEWVNKSSGRGDTELIVDDGISVKNYKYPYWFPYTPYNIVFPHLFPWATFEADECFYEDSDIEQWHNLHCYYEKDLDEWVCIGNSFEEFRKSLDPMRSIDHSGEVAEFMLKLRLNELGESFLTVENFVSNNQPYTDTRPKGE